MTALRMRRIPVPTLRILGVLGVIYLVFGLLSPEAFLSVDNIISIALAASGILILATGMTVLIVAGQLDLSIGSQLVLSAVVGAAVMNGMAQSSSAVRLTVGVTVSIVVGAAYGLVNGLATTRLKVPSLIVTLGTLGIGLGLAQLLTSAGGSTSFPAPGELTAFGLARIGEVPVIVVVAVLVAVIVGLVLAFTRFGLYCYAVGSNQEGARRVGVPTARTLVAAFVMMGSLSGIAGVLDLARFSAVSVATHQYDNVTAIAAVIIGGASLYGGRGTVFGTAVGTLIPIVLLQGFVILNVNPSWQNVAIGTVLVAAVAIDHYERTSRRARAETLAAEGDVAAPIDPVNPTPSEGQPR